MTMPEKTGDSAKDELNKYMSIATDLGVAMRMRVQAIDLIAEIGNHEALLSLLTLAGNDRLDFSERDLALKKSRELIKKGN
jgi:hypothetical protein